MRYEIILFDADGTLLDFSRGESEAVSETMEIAGIEPTEERIQAYSEINDAMWKMLERGEIERKVLLYKRFEVFCERFGFSADAEKMAVDYRICLSKKGHMLDGAEELLKRLSGKCRMFIVTNGVESTQMGRFARCVIPQYMEKIFVSEAVGYEKPDVRFFEKLSSEIEGFEKARAVIVGDSLTSDMRGGINYGIDTCWFAPNGKNPPEGMDITKVARSFDDIYDFLVGGEY